MVKNKEMKTLGINILIVGATVLLATLGEGALGNYQRNIMNLAGVYVIAALSMNLINGFTGMFSLGHAGFMAIGAYTTVLFVMPTAVKQQNFYMSAINPFLYKLGAPFPVALLMGGLVAAVIGFIVSSPILRLTDDYLAIATLGFSEIIRILIINLQSITNGALGLTGVPRMSSLSWVWGCAALSFVLIRMLIRSSYGMALVAIREDEIAAQSMGIGLYKHKVLSFTVGCFFAGVAGGLLACHTGTIDANTFTFSFTFNILLMVVLGGMGNLKGSVLAAIVVTYAQEWLRFLDEPIAIGGIQLAANPGLRMVVFSALLMMVVIFRKDRTLKPLKRGVKHAENS